ncbi:MAG: PsbP-related protein [Bacillota bacterium]|nr:PsbP-related protein [Bacillota bacterium]
MHVVFISNYKKKLFRTCLILVAWIGLFIILNILLSKNINYKFTINNCLSFSCPVDFKVENIFVNEHNKDETIETGLPFVNPRTETFSNYKSIKGKFSFDYPSIFVLNEREFSGSEILYHIEFKSDGTNGFVQVWNLPYSLNEFLEKAKSTSQLKFEYFSSKPIKVNGLEGYFWDYSITDRNGKQIKCNEVFLQKDNKIYRISYFVPEEQWNAYQKKIFFDIVNSLKIY